MRVLPTFSTLVHTKSEQKVSHILYMGETMPMLRHQFRLENEDKMRQLIEEIIREFSVSEEAAFRLFDQIFACYASPDNSFLAVEKAEYSVRLAPSGHFAKKWIALYPTAVVIVGETHNGTRALLRIAEVPELRLH